MNPPVVVQRFRKELQRQQDERHERLLSAAERIKQWREEDERNGITWGLKDGGKA